MVMVMAAIVCPLLGEGLSMVSPQLAVTCRPSPHCPHPSFQVTLPHLRGSTSNLPHLRGSRHATKRTSGQRQREIWPDLFHMTLSRYEAFHNCHSRLSLLFSGPSAAFVAILWRLSTKPTQVPYWYCIYPRCTRVIFWNIIHASSEVNLIFISLFFNHSRIFAHPRLTARQSHPRTPSRCSKSR